MASRIDKARKLRREMSPPEAKLWRHLRTRPRGLKFRRQHPMGRFTLDFYCRSAAIAIEVDGDAHDMGSNPQRDEACDQRLRKRGIETLRFLALDVMQGFEVVARQVEDVCASRTPSTGSAGPPPRQRPGRTG